MTMDKQTINSILVGKTHSIARGKEGDVAYLYFKSEKACFMKRGDEIPLQGSWQLSEQGFNVQWQGGPSKEWMLELSDGNLTFSLENNVVIGASRNWQEGDVQALEIELEAKGT